MKLSSLVLITFLLSACVTGPEKQAFDPSLSFYDTRHPDYQPFPIFCFAENNCIVPTPELRGEWMRRHGLPEGGN